MNKLKLFMAVLLSVPFLSFATVAADNPLNPACQTNDKTRKSAICNDPNINGQKDPIAGPNGIISKTANLIALITGIAAVIMVIIGGFFYITSAGSAENAKKAKDRIIAAVVGVVIVAFAWAIVRLISDNVLG
jgi:hypothetical protein